MTRRSTSLLLLVLLCAATAQRLVAQPAGRIHWWIGAGLGGSSLGFVSASASAGLSVGNTAVLLRATENAESLFGNEYWDAGLLLGYVHTDEILTYTFGLGVAAVGGTEGHGIFGGPRTTLATHIGLPLEAQAHYYLTDWCGLGLHGFAEFSATRSWFGLAASLRFGDLR